MLQNTLCTTCTTLPLVNDRTGTFFKFALRQGGNVNCGTAAVPASNKNVTSNPLTLVPIKKHTLTQVELTEDY